MKYYKNPNQKQFLHCMTKSTYKEIKGIVHTSTRDVYIFDGDGLHSLAASELGISHYDYDSFWIYLDEGRYTKDMYNEVSLEDLTFLKGLDFGNSVSREKEDA